MSDPRTWLETLPWRTSAKGNEYLRVSGGKYAVVFEQRDGWGALVGDGNGKQFLPDIYYSPDHPRMSRSIS